MSEFSSPHLPPITSRSTSTREVKIDDIQIRTTDSREKLNLFELQEHVKLLQEDNKKKDELIQKLSSMEIRPVSNNLINSVVGSGIANQSARSEIAAMQVKLDNYLNRLREKEIEVENKNESIVILKHEVERLKEDNARQSSQFMSLTQQLEEYEDSRNAFDNFRSRNETAVRSLQTQYDKGQEKIVELEAKLRLLRDEQEKHRTEMDKTNGQYNRLANEIVRLLNLPTTKQPIVETASKRITLLLEENSTLKSQFKSLKDSLEANEKEQKASRETIMRLVSEVSRGQTDLDAKTQSETKLKQVVADLEKEKTQLQARIGDLQKQLETMNRRHTATFEELSLVKSQADTLRASIVLPSKTREQELEKECEELHERVHHLTAELEQFNNQVRNVRKESQKLVAEAVPEVRERQLSMKKSVERKESSEKVKQKAPDHKIILESLNVLTSELIQTQQKRPTINLQANLDLEVKERTRALEAEIASYEVMVENLRADKEKFFKYMQRLAEIMRMDRINADIGFDMIGEALVARAEQLSRGELDLSADRNALMYSLKRRVKQLKEQLESRDLHLDLLRKKIAHMEERISGKTEVEKERDMETMQVRKLVKQLDKTQAIVQQLRDENVNLKAQLLEFSNYKITALEQSKKLESSKQKLAAMTEGNNHNKSKIRTLESELAKREKEWRESSEIQDHSLKSLSSELRVTQEQYEDTRRKEKQLLEFRAVVGRLLGLDLEMLAIPDYEIINRLERLVQAHHSNVYTAFTMEKALSGLDHQFRAAGPATHLYAAGYRGPVSTLPGDHNSTS